MTASDLEAHGNYFRKRQRKEFYLVLMHYQPVIQINSTKSSKLRTILIQEYNEALKTCDVLLATCQSQLAVKNWRVDQ